MQDRFKVDGQKEQLNSILIYSRQRKVGRNKRETVWWLTKKQSGQGMLKTEVAWKRLQQTEVELISLIHFVG